MEQKFIVAVNSKNLASQADFKKLLGQRKLLPFGTSIGFMQEGAQVALKFRKVNGEVTVISGSKIANIKNIFCLTVDPDLFSDLVQQLTSSDYLFLVFEGSPKEVSVSLSFESGDQNAFNELERLVPTLRLQVYDLPPTDITVIDAPVVKANILNYLSNRDKELFAVPVQQFLKTPHVLTYLFSHVMALDSREHLNYIAVLRVAAEKIRELLKPWIRRIEKNHKQLWGDLYGERISFVDGGLSRIVSLPGTEPTGIRVGVYTVVPGETDLEQREEWQMNSWVIGDVISDRSLIEEPDYRTDSKRLQEAARYILEPLAALKYLEDSTTKPRFLLLHGPLQNSFEEYDEKDPNFIPGVSDDFLLSCRISRKEIEREIAGIASDHKGRILSNACIPVYSYVMKRIFENEIPILGVVERGASTSLTRRILDFLNGEGVITKSTRDAFLQKIGKYEIEDELLFGCILNEGEYIDPVPLKKNFRNRAHDRWQSVIENFPVPLATMIKCSANNFPFRVEFNRATEIDRLDLIMRLIYHTALLLPHYAFPVGLDIVDKYVKIPDWLSKGISEMLTASILNKVLETGDEKLLRQVRQRLALSPRDFFF